MVHYFSLITFHVMILKTLLVGLLYMYLFYMLMKSSVGSYIWIRLPKSITRHFLDIVNCILNYLAKIQIFRKIHSSI